MDGAQMIHDPQVDKFLKTYMVGRTTDEMSRALLEVIAIVSSLTGDLPELQSDADDFPQRYSMNLNTVQMAALAAAAGLGHAFGEMMIKHTPGHPTNDKDAGDAPTL